MNEHTFQFACPICQHENKVPYIIERERALLPAHHRCFKCGTTSELIINGRSATEYPRRDQSETP